jgi:hypothetical protein
LFRDAGVCPILKPFFPHIPALSSVEFLGEMSDFLHSGALLPPHPSAHFSHKRRRRILGVLMPETEDDMQGLPKNPPL